MSNNSNEFDSSIHNEVLSEGVVVGYTLKPAKPQCIDITVTLSDDSCLIGAPIEYLIEFSENVTVPGIVPISITDRNGNHVTNIGCSIKDGKASGTFTMGKAGDFTVTDEAINYHKAAIIADLRLTSQPWLRVYQ
ncbi:MAG: hypothetical protein GY820_35105 [Gammaproteobacteria bacterium]|nr:hypothetical protein [Pseudoalteromonas sp.]MCP4492499.1 hypothetical protein [Gammaproteobacteria bacterium]